MYILFESVLGLPKPEYLALRPEDADNSTPQGIARTKMRCRKYLEGQSGCKVIGTVGDMCWDHTDKIDDLERSCMRAHKAELVRPARAKRASAPERACFAGLWRDKVVLKLPGSFD